MPVMMTISGSPECSVTVLPPFSLAAGGVGGASLPPPQGTGDRIREQRAETFHLGDLFRRCLPQLAD
jgi:hypothetical protein